MHRQLELQEVLLMGRSSLLNVKMWINLVNNHSIGSFWCKTVKKKKKFLRPLGWCHLLAGVCCLLASWSHLATSLTQLAPKSLSWYVIADKSIMGDGFYTATLCEQRWAFQAALSNFSTDHAAVMVDVMGFAAVVSTLMLISYSLSGPWQVFLKIWPRHFLFLSSKHNQASI